MPKPKVKAAPQAPAKGAASPEEVMAEAKALAEATGETLTDDELDSLRRALPSEDGPIGPDGEIRPVAIGKRGRTPNPMTTIFILDDVEYQIPAKPSPALVIKWMRESQVKPGTSAKKAKAIRYAATESVLLTLLGQKALDALAESPDVTAEDMADIFAIVGRIFFGAQQNLQAAADPS